MRKLLIKIFNSDNHELVETVICEHLDATERTTNLFRYSIPGIPTLRNTVGEMYCIPAKIARWDIFEGLITIYYQSGFEMEISRIVSQDPAAN